MIPSDSNAADSLQPGLVRLLEDYNITLPALPTPTTLPVLMPADAARARIEVADFLDARQQADIALSDVNPQWLAEFTEYLTLFYPLEQVNRYVAAVQFVQHQNTVGAGSNE